MMAAVLFRFRSILYLKNVEPSFLIEYGPWPMKTCFNAGKGRGMPKDNCFWNLAQMDSISIPLQVCLLVVRDGSRTIYVAFLELIW